MKPAKRYANIVYMTLSCSLVIFLHACTQKEAQKTTEKEAGAQQENGQDPHIIFILADDMGYSDLSSFGGEIPTPHLDRLAERGTKFTHFYNTARCSPSRASLLTGQYPHQVGIGTLAKEKRGEEGPYQGYLEKVPTLASTLKAEGYTTYMTGKWHLGQERENWPMAYGFDNYFGLLSGASSYFELIENQPRKRKMAYNDKEWSPPVENFYMTTAFTDTAVSYVQRHDTEKPLFMYLAYTAPHWPLHALAEDIALFEGKYNAGWDSLATQRFNKMKELRLVNNSLALPPRPENIPEWSSLSETEKAGWERLMEVYAAMMYRMDQGVGQLMQALEEKGMADNTIIMFASDNGADPSDVRKRQTIDEHGEPNGTIHDDSVPLGLQGSFASYRTPWAHLSNTPYRDYKKSSFWGGMRTPFIYYDGRNPQTESSLIHSHTHLIDILPTALALAKADTTYNGLEGKNLLPLIENGKSETNLENRPIFMEHEGYKAIIQGKWKLLKEPFKENWLLFDLEADPLEQTNVAKTATNAATIKQLQELYSAWEKRTSSYSLPKYYP